MKKLMLFMSMIVAGELCAENAHEIANKMKGVAGAGKAMVQIWAGGDSSKMTRGNAAIDLVVKGANTINTTANLIDRLSDYTSKANQLIQKLQCVSAKGPSCASAKNEALVEAIFAIDTFVSTLADDVFGKLAASGDTVIDQGVVVSALELLNGGIVTANVFKPGFIGDAGKARVAMVQKMALTTRAQVKKNMDVLKLLALALDVDRALAEFAKSAPQDSAAAQKTATDGDFKAENIPTASVDQVTPGETDISALL